MKKGNNTYAYDAEEFAKLLGIPDPKSVVAVKWSAQTGKVVVYVKPGSTS
jgi:hypothetical protein